ncbi:unnamed protein product [Porites evermanni]|uniref:Uncharacterized protein n=1 Tax=Porites evermanni TaxID=104178 RepID=A0ABN8R659_9CNID|nr:unnamed protein product [Porites evermanni]
MLVQQLDDCIPDSLESTALESTLQQQIELLVLKMSMLHQVNNEEQRRAQGGMEHETHVTGQNLLEQHEQQFIPDSLEVFK